MPDNGGSDITGYCITISPPPSVSCSTGTCTVSGDTSQYTFTGLNYTEQYNVSVAASNCVGTSSNVSVILAIGKFLMQILLIDLFIVPSVPRGVTASNMNDNSIKVEWQVS